MRSKQLEVSLGLLREDSRLQVRSPRSIKALQREVVEKSLEDSVEKFKVILDTGSTLDPIEVFEDDGLYYIIDGHHRYRAYLEHEGFEPPFNEPDSNARKVPVLVRDGDLLHHLRASHTVNTKHGVGLEKGERTQRLLFSLVHTPQAEWKPIKEMVRETALSESQIDKIRRAARTLIEEAGIAPPYDPDDIQTQIEQWVAQKKKVHKTADGKSRVPTDDQGYPSVTYVNTRKAVAEVDDDTIVKSRVIKYLEPYAMNNPEAVRAAVKRLNKLYDLGITVKSSWTPPIEEEDF
ncbi:ParB/RepB/Spo0J family partition protein [Pseudoalteromonas sp. CnMc7-15]|uniref:ParB/RepB/Spo0J family partition protein n=1 Tax=unclassified Pseudoalteromonas TaxID=194690 RepID=UPI001EF62CE7|nr:ParB/RepB/Spo0J family partition protein [Pseudoalteromonas sp. CnMc7-15]MCG7566548.1 ParB/RepB/Spo0J family partition protein [Pseudoalteromonas sp. CnMc7-15]